VWHAASAAWVPVRHVPDAFVINLGDLLQRWTNDRWRSTLHRVVNPPASAHTSNRRQSMAFFHNANYHCLVECIPTCLVPGERPRHEPVVAGPHLMAKYHRASGPDAAEGGN
jgi:isopenicillin N synthase-like dioxygenase